MVNEVGLLSGNTSHFTVKVNICLFTQNLTVLSVLSHLGRNDYKMMKWSPNTLAWLHAGPIPIACAHLSSRYIQNATGEEMGNVGGVWMWG